MKKVLMILLTIYLIMGVSSFLLQGKSKEKEKTPEETAKKINTTHSDYKNTKTSVDNGTKGKEEELDEMLKEAYDCPLTLKKCKSKLESLKKRFDSYKKSLEKLKDKLKKIKKEDLDKIDEKIKELETERDDIDRELKELGFLPVAEKELDDKEKKRLKNVDLKKVEENKKKLRDQLDKMEGELIDLLIEGQKQRKKHPEVVNLDKAIQKLRQARAAKERAREAAPPDAKAYFDQEIQKLNDKIEKLEDKLKEKEKNAGLAAGIMKKIKNKKNAIDDAKKRNLPKMRKLNEKQRKGFQTAKENYDETKKGIEELENKLNELLSKLQLLWEYLKEKAKGENKDKDEFERLKKEIEKVLGLTKPPGAPPRVPRHWGIAVTGSYGWTNMSALNNYIKWINTTYSGNIGELNTTLGGSLTVFYQINSTVSIGASYEYLSATSEGTLTITAPPATLTHSQFISANGFLGIVSLKIPLNISKLALRTFAGAGMYFANYHETENGSDVKGDGSGFGYKAGLGLHYEFADGFESGVITSWNGGSVNQFKDNAGNTLQFVSAYNSGEDISADFSGFSVSLIFVVKF